MRGRLTEEIQTAARRVLGREITLTELRLMPYIQYVMMNEQALDAYKINQEKRGVLSMWREAGWIELGAGGLSITKEFWDALSEILWIGYVVQGAE